MHHDIEPMKIQEEITFGITSRYPSLDDAYHNLRSFSSISMETIAKEASVCFPGALDQ